MFPHGCRGNDDGGDGRRREGGSGALAGVLPGLGSGMARGPYAGQRLGQARRLPAMCPSGPLVLPDAGPGPGRWLKPWSRPAHPWPALLSSGPGLVVLGRAEVQARGAGRRQERQRDRSRSAPGGATAEPGALMK